MSRDNLIRLSDSEMVALEQLKESQFSEDTPYGKVVGSVANEEVLSEQKQILVTGEGDNISYGDQNNRISGPRVDVISRPIGKSGSRIRGLSPDLVILLTDIEDEIMGDVVKPMCSKIIHLY